MRLNRLKVSNCDKETGGPKGEHRFIQANSFGLTVTYPVARDVRLTITYLTAEGLRIPSASAIFMRTTENSCAIRYGQVEAWFSVDFYYADRQGIRFPAVDAGCVTLAFP